MNIKGLYSVILTIIVTTTMERLNIPYVKTPLVYCMIYFSFYLFEKKLKEDK